MQNGRPLSTYYNELVAIFQEIDHRTISQEGTVKGVVQLYSAMARLQVHIFLSGLDSEFDQVHGEILRKDQQIDLKSHSKQRCYEIIGYPEWWDFTKKPRKKIAGKAMVTSTEEDQSPPTTNVAHPGGGESYTEEHVLQGGGGGDEFIELEEVNEWLINGGQKGYESVPEIESNVLVQPKMTADAPDMAESSMPSELPMSTPSTIESTENVLP
ncbi:hypothetical protein F0562_022016 [Nyssa sinensis]|uniref:Uncharacterized protein n=1 Tax=Nyssa sinensis TaxID=561372 RepID=A0A5J5BPT8_9ASTE|nr:hypothetical protein F0562_022016 [Nyssa sinensis]